MRINEPVTNREVELRADSVIVSKTDAKGKITFINRDFIEISGFTEEELIGQPHNIVRHPDMPVEAFEDLWTDLKAGKPWSGYVKNRCKNGDYYWVLANVTPLIEDGKLSGCISVRSKPQRSVTETVGGIYRQFKEGKAGDLLIQHGRVVSNALYARMKRRFSGFGSKMNIMSALMCITILLVGGVGIFVSSVTKESLRTVYEDRVICMDQLSKIGSLLDDNIQSLMLITHNDANYPAPELVSRIEKNAEEVSKIWADYMATYLNQEEKVLADNFAKERQTFLTEALNPSLALARAGKIAELSQLIDRTVMPFYKKINKSQDDLLELQMRVAKEEYEKSKKNSQIGMLATIGGILTGVIIAFAAIRGILKHVRNPLGKIKVAIEGMSRGDYSSDVSVDSEDEFGEIVLLFKILQSKVVYSINETKEKEIQNQKQRKAEMCKVADDFQKQVGAIVDGVCAAATELQATAESMAAATEETSKQSNTVAAAAEQASANVQTVASATEELSASVKEIQSSVSNSNSMVARAADQAAATNSKVKDLATASQKIGEVVSLINDIAAQTNLLALNATIEAARAGDAGKGFAVVASEVKALAGQTAKATEEIARQVQDIQLASSSSATAIQQIAQAVEEVKKSSTAISAAVEEQGSTTQEIARNVNEAAMGTKEVSSNIAGVSQAAQHTGESAAQVLSASSELARNGERLRAQVDQFLNAVRAA